MNEQLNSGDLERIDRDVALMNACAALAKECATPEQSVNVASIGYAAAKRAAAVLSREETTEVEKHVR